MENKYFVPDIEDFCIGVVYEYFGQGLQFDECGRFIPDEIRDDEFMWRGSVVKYPSDILHISIKLSKGNIRIPYLTKEQIKAEGWWMNGDNVFVKKDHVLIIYPTQNKIEIRHLGHPSYTISSFYLGECKDINTFRKICKLLNIK